MSLRSNTEDIYRHLWQLKHTLYHQMLESWAEFFINIFRKCFLPILGTGCEWKISHIFKNKKTRNKNGLWPLIILADSLYESIQMVHKKLRFPIIRGNGYCMESLIMVIWQYSKQGKYVAVKPEKVVKGCGQS